MRFQFTDNSTFTAPATTVFELERVRLDMLTTTANKRDVWIRVLCHTDEALLPTIYATKTKAEANAITATLGTNSARVAAGVLGYVEYIDPISAPQSITLTRQTGVTPDMTGLTVLVDGTPSASAWDFVAGYVASPAMEVYGAIHTLLKARMSSGQILDGFTAAEVTTCHDQMTILSTSNQITAVHVEERDQPAATGYDGRLVNYSVIIGRARSNEEGGYETILTVGDNVWSLLGDEARTLGGLISTHRVMSMEGPTPIDGEDGTYQAVRINGEAFFPMMRRDS